nr:unnamed protein product [Callosobruchus analis]
MLYVWLGAKIVLSKTCCMRIFIGGSIIILHKKLRHMSILYKKSFDGNLKSLDFLKKSSIKIISNLPEAPKQPVGFGRDARNNIVK